MISINLPLIGDEEVEAVTQVLRSGILTSGLGAGPKVTEFEKKFSELADAKHAIAMNTGTAALHAAVLSAIVKPGDEVILPSFTFVATVEAVVLSGANPIFVDIDPETYTIAPSNVEKAITRKTKAIMPVDLYGLPADVKPVKEIASKYGIAILEDAAQAHGAEYYGKPVGAFSDAACWSLYASKNITTGEGGVMTTNNVGMAETARMIRTHGEKAKYASQMLGCNYRMTEIQAAMGIVQIRKLGEFVTKRRLNAERLSDILKRTDRLQLPHDSTTRRHSWYLYTVRLKDSNETVRNRIVAELRKKGIGAEVYYSNPVHMMPYYSRRFGSCKLTETERAAKQVFSLPVHPGVTEEQIDYIGNTLLSLL